MAALLQGDTLVLTGVVGDDWFGDGFTHGDVVIALANYDPAAELTVRINSGGGVATEGAAIHALLAARPGDTHVIVDGIAASAASLIAMAGDTITMSAGAVMMVHDPAGMTFGDVAAHEKTIEALEALSSAYASIYAARTGRPVGQMREMMRAETWLTAEAAIGEGFADGALGSGDAEAAAFDYATAYARAPERLVALAKARGWRAQTNPNPNPNPKIAASAASTGSNQEVVMPDDKKADRTAELEAQIAELTESLNAEREARADSERRAAIMALSEAQANPDEARAMADNGVSVDAAKAIFAARKTATPPAETPEAYERRRLAAPADNDRPTASASWSKAVARVNERLGAR